MCYEGDCSIAVEQREIVGEHKPTRTFFQKTESDFISRTKKPRGSPLYLFYPSAFMCPNWVMLHVS